mgnify:CR=1 FL=1
MANVLFEDVQLERRFVEVAAVELPQRLLLDHVDLEFLEFAALVISIANELLVWYVSKSSVKLGLTTASIVCGGESAPSSFLQGVLLRTSWLSPPLYSARTSSSFR